MTKNKTIEDLMGKVTRLRTNLQEEKIEFWKLEDELEIVLDSWLSSDKEIQKTNDIKEWKNPKFNDALLDQTTEKNNQLKSHKESTE